MLIRAFLGYVFWILTGKYNLVITFNVKTFVPCLISILTLRYVSCTITIKANLENSIVILFLVLQFK